MNIPGHIFKAYDIRGIYPDELNEENLPVILAAIHKFFTEKTDNEKLKIVLGRDMRLSSPSLFDIGLETLTDLGADVIDIGPAATPTFYYGSLKYGYDAGVMVSASHNPPEYNGLKFVIRDEDRLIKIGKTTGMEQVKKYALSKQSLRSERKGRIKKESEVTEKEVNDALKSVNEGRLRPLRVVADPANAMGIIYLEKLFGATPCELIKINFELDGTFPSHHPDPLKFETLSQLQREVRNKGADLGIATDGDGDRVFFIDEKGEIIPATAITSIISKRLLRKSPGEKIIVDVRYTYNAKKIIQKNKGEMLESVVGHALISQQLNKENAVFAGESSGHFFYRETGGAESAVLTILHILDELGKTEKPASAIVADITSAKESGEVNFRLPGELKADRVFNHFAEKYSDARIYFLDGVTIEYPKWRFNIRASNTEPLIRLNLEGYSADSVKAKLDKIKEELQQLGAKLEK